MAKIILNNEEFDFQGYSRNTYFNEDTMSGTGYISGVSGSNLATRIQALAFQPITSITIKKSDDTVIYSLENIDVKIQSVDEAYNGVDMVITNLNLIFNQ